MNNQARICNLKCKHNIQGVCYAYGECIAKDLFVAELEKIKTEMEDKLEPFILGERNLKKDALQILDKRIAELKGE